MPPYPGFRLAKEWPFTHTGLDYAGPVIVRYENERKKAWIALFTCLNTRAVHLEVVTDLSTLTFLQAMRRFVARRRRPTTILSDNGPQFVLAEKVIRDTWKNVTDHAEVQSYCASEGISWKFIPELSPWMGGVYERMVGLVKNALRRSMGRKLLTLEEFITLVTEAEAVVNCRPLTYVGNENDGRILRPMDFLNIDSTPGVPVLRSTDYVDTWRPQQLSSQEQILIAWSSTLEVLNHFWTLWINDYLQSLRERFQTEHRNPYSTATHKIGLGEIVLIREEMMPRGTWRIGRVTQLGNSADNEIRFAKVRVKEDSKNGLYSYSTLTRPIKDLYSLEIQATVLDDGATNTTEAEAPAAPPAENPMPMEVDETQLDNEEPPSKVARSGPYDLRPRKKVSYAFFTIASLVMIFCPTTVSADEGVYASSITRCPNESSTGYRMTWTQTCRRDGVAIYQRQSGYCWSFVHCDHGEHLQLPTNATDWENTACGPLCPCPAWSRACSFYAGEGTAKSRSEFFGQLLLSNAPSKICSTFPSPNCSSETQQSKFYRVELYDNSTFLLQSMSMSFAQVYDNHYKCIGKGPVTGTHAYCESHACVDNGTQLCYYEQPESLLLELNGSSIPIRAWGIVRTTYFGHPKPSRHRVKYHCANGPCVVSCSNKGVHIQTLLEYHPIEICTRKTCILLRSHDYTDIVPLPPYLTLYEHDVHVTAWHHGHKAFTKHIRCPAVPHCEYVRCYACIDRLLNLQCTPVGTLLAAIALLYILLLIGQCLSLVAIFAKIIYAVLRIVLLPVQLPLQYVLIRCRRDRSNTQPLDQPLDRNRGSRSSVPSHGIGGKYTPAVFAMLALCSNAYGCADVTTFTAQEHSCSLSSNGSLHCLFSETTVLSFPPNGQDLCLSLDSGTNHSLGSIAIQIGEVQAVCRKKTQYFTREHELKVQSIKRCASAGSCKGSTCSDLKTTDSISELDSETNNSPGYSYCLDSCGCAGCGCFLCSSACLFYRTFAVPSTDTVHEIFSCPTFEYRIPTTIRLMVNGSTDTQEIKLEPGKPFQWNNLSLTVLSATVPPAPMLGSDFVTDGKRMAMVSSVVPGTLTPGTIGQLQCPTKDDAAKFKCNFGPTACTCQSSESSVNCQCASDQVSPSYAQRDKALPLETNGALIRPEGASIVAAFRHIAGIQIQVTMRNFSLVTQVEENSCSLTIGELSGCYNCNSGAKLDVTCNTDFGSASATLRCAHSTALINCNETGVSSEVYLTYPTSTVTDNCSLTCPAGTTYLAISGQLSFIPNLELNSLYHRLWNSSKEVVSDISLLATLSAIGDSVASLFSGFTWPMRFAIVLLTVIVLALVCYVATHTATMLTLAAPWLRLFRRRESRGLPRKSRKKAKEPKIAKRSRKQ